MTSIPKHSRFVCVVVFLAAIGLAVQSPGQVDNQTQDQDAVAKAPSGAPKAPKAADGDKKAKRFPDFKDVIKDMEVTEGLFTLYRYDPGDKERDSEKLLCKIPKGLLNEDLLFATSISRGGQFTGWMWRDHLIRWEVVGKHLKMVTPDTRYVHKKGKPVTDAVKRTYNETFLVSMPIVTMTPGGAPVIDLGKLLKSDLADVSFMGPRNARIRAELSKWMKVKVFPDNILIDVDLAIQGGRGGRLVGVSYAFRRLPKLGSYTPRAADDRIGYFLTAKMDWSKSAGARDTFVRYINRWKLEKRDPSLELSPPKKPITFIIEKTVPIQWRRWVRQGIEDWNKAFEKIGFVDAIVVQQQTEDNEFADYDPEDARYNFFRWIVSGRAFAMGPSRVDPRTGQILDADIIMDDSFVRAWMQDFDIFAPSSMAELRGPGFKMWMDQHPELLPRFLSEPVDEPAGGPAALREIAEAKLRASGRHVCSYAFGLQQQLAFVHNALLATGSGKKIPEHFVGEAIREAVTHEVGHTLGLRHNFKASSWLTLEEIRRRRNEGDEPTSASVMDYNPLLFFAGDDPEKVRHFVTPTIGPWDYWVIEYGHRVPEKGQSEKEMLEEVASRCAEKGLDYATDEDTMWVFSPDPLTNRYDNSSDLVAWARSRIELCDRLTENIADWAIRKGESRYHVRQAFDQVWFEKGRNFEYVTRLVGGQYFHRDHKGDADARPPFVLVDAETQRAALNLLKETLLTDTFFKFDPALLNQLAPSRWRHWGSRTSLELDYPIHDRIVGLQLVGLFDLLTPPVLQRVYDAELKSDDPNRFTAAELIRTLRDHIWSSAYEVGEGPYTDAKPFISSITRNLQQGYLDLMLIHAQARLGANFSLDLYVMIRSSLRELSDRIGQTLEKAGSKLDFASRGHLVECKSRIDRVLEAQFSAR